MPSQVPPVLWLARSQPAVDALHTAQYAVRVSDAAEIDALADALILPHVLEIAIGGESWSIVDVRDPAPAPLRRGTRISEVPVIDKALEAQLLYSPPEPGPSYAGERVQYQRPISSAERDGLRARGFAPCGCSGQRGHCFCNWRSMYRRRAGRGR
jgi:hypothetical protein